MTQLLSKQRIAPAFPRHFVDLLQVLAHPTRLQVVLLLAEHERTAGELATALDLRSNLLAHHLRALRAAGIVVSKPDQTDGRSKRYALDRAALASLGVSLAALGGARAEPAAPGSDEAVARLLATMARTADGFFVISADYSIVLWNAGAEALLGHRAREVIGRPCHEVIRGRDPSDQLVCTRPCRPMQLVAAGMPPACFPLRAAGPSGDTRAIGMTILPLSGGLTAHVFHDARRQSALERLATQISQALGRLQGLSEPAEPTAREELAITPPLTGRERQVLRLLAEGADTDTIAARLVIGRSTARKHIQSILAKLGVHSRLEAVAVATRLRLLP